MRQSPFKGNATGGKLQQFGTADEVYRHPRTRFVAQFMGETNLIEATVVRDADGAAAVDVAGRRIDLGEVDTKGLEAGMKIAIGLRAEQLAVAPKTAASGVWTATVTSISSAPIPVLARTPRIGAASRASSPDPVRT